MLLTTGLIHSFTSHDSVRNTKQYVQPFHLSNQLSATMYLPQSADSSFFMHQFSHVTFNVIRGQGAWSLVPAEECHEIVLRVLIPIFVTSMIRTCADTCFDKGRVALFDQLKNVVDIYYRLDDHMTSKTLQELQHVCVADPALRQKE